MTRLRWKHFDPVPGIDPQDAPIAADDLLQTALGKAQGQIDVIKDRVNAVEANIQGSAIIDLTGVVGTYQMTQEDSRKGVLVFLNDDAVTTVSLYDSQQNPSRYLLLSCPSVEKLVPTNFRCGLNNSVVPIPGLMYTEVAYGYYQAYEFYYAKLQEFEHGDIKVEGDLLTWTILPDTVSADKLTQAVRDDIDGKEPTIAAGSVTQYYRGDKTFQTLDKTAVGLSNVDNTSDLNKPISTATQTALNGKEPTIAAGSVTQYYRGDKTFQTLDKTAVGLSNVDNTSDLNKPISTATQTALNGKEPTIAAGAVTEYYRGDKTFQTLDKTAVGLSNVDNTSDLNKPISTATQTALNGKLDKSYSAFGTFISTSPAHPALDNSDLFPVMDGLAAFFSKQVSYSQLKAALKSYFDTVYLAVLNNATLGALMQGGGIKVPVDADTVPFMDSTNAFAQVKTSWGGIKAFLFSSPLMTGTPAAPTAAANTNTAQLATTQFVVTQNQTVAAQTAPANPASTTSLTGVMMGLAASITPIRKGRVLITITGDIETSGNGNGGALQIRTGTGAAPANGVAATGTAQGSIVNYRNPANNIIRVPFSASAIVSGLTLGTAVWIDLGLAAVIGGTAAVRNVSISAVEL